MIVRSFVYGFLLILVTSPLMGKTKHRRTAEEMCDLSKTAHPPILTEESENEEIVEEKPSGKHPKLTLEEMYDLSNAVASKTLIEVSKEDAVETKQGQFSWKPHKVTPEEMCDLSVTLHASYQDPLDLSEQGLEGDLEEDARWRRHRNHLFFPFLAEEHQGRLSQCMVVFTLPKGGSHLIYTMIELIAGKEEQSQMTSSVPMGFPISLKEGREVFFSPVLSSDYRFIMDKEEIAKIVMIRDPRDLLISQLYWASASGQCPRPLEEWKTLSLEDQIKELLLWDSPQSIAALTREMVTCLRSKTTYVCRFEDLVGSQGGGNDALQNTSIVSLANYLGMPLSLAEAERIGRQAFRLSGSLREQQMGIFRYYFSEDNLKLCQALLGKEIELLGYPTN